MESFTEILSFLWSSLLLHWEVWFLVTLTVSFCLVLQYTQARSKVTPVLITKN